MSFILEAERLVKKFRATAAINDVSLAVEPGEVFGLVGPDGAGKSTLLRLLVGVLAPDSGRVRIGGRDTRDSRSAAEMIGYVPQRFALAPGLTVRENLVFTADVFGVPPAERERRMNELLDFCGLAQFAGRLSGRLSGGMQRKLTLICALIHRPPLLLLDEPTTGVDPVSRRDFWDLLHSLAREGLAEVVATTYLEEAERCHRVGILHAGRMALCDTPAALKESFAEQVIEVWPSDGTEPMRSAIEETPGVVGAQLTGDHLRVYVEKGIAPAALVEQARRNGAAIADWTEAEPAIADVFTRFLQESQAVK